MGIFSMLQQTHPLQASPHETLATATDLSYHRPAKAPLSPAEAARRQWRLSRPKRTPRSSASSSRHPALAHPAPRLPKQRPAIARGAPGTPTAGRGGSPVPPLTSPQGSPSSHAAQDTARALSLPCLNAPGPRGLAPASTASEGGGPQRRRRRRPGWARQGGEPVAAGDTSNVRHSPARPPVR